MDRTCPLWYESNAWGSFLESQNLIHLKRRTPSGKWSPKCWMKWDKRWRSLPQKERWRRFLLWPRYKDGEGTKVFRFSLWQRYWEEKVHIGTIILLRLRGIRSLLWPSYWGGEGYYCDQGIEREKVFIVTKLKGRRFLMWPGYLEGEGSCQIQSVSVMLV